MPIFLAQISRAKAVGLLPAFIQFAMFTQRVRGCIENLIFFAPLRLSLAF
jgi:hypothetical protein